MVRGMYGEEHLDRVEQIRRFAEDSGTTMVELAFAWLLSAPGVASVIAGATSPEQVIQNARAAASTVSPELRAALDLSLGASRNQTHRKQQADEDDQQETMRRAR